MRRIVVMLGVLLVALVAPAAALARTGLSGALKQTVVGAYTERAGLDASARQTSACFGAWKHGDWAVVESGYGAFRHPNWYRYQGLCEISPMSSEEFELRTMVLKNVGPGYWPVRMQFQAPPTVRAVNRARVPLGVFRDLTGISLRPRFRPCALSNRDFVKSLDATQNVSCAAAHRVLTVFDGQEFPPWRAAGAAWWNGSRHVFDHQRLELSWLYSTDGRTIEFVSQPYG